MHVAWFPKTDSLDGNPYWSQLAAELSPIGIEFSEDHHSYWMTRKWLWQNRHSVKILHFHFLQPFYANEHETASVKRLLRFLADLILAKLLGYKIIWTVHDLMPPWPKKPAWVEHWARWAMVKIADGLIVHCQAAVDSVESHFGRNPNIHIIPLPSYASVHPNKITRSQAREALQLTDNQFVITFVGGIRPNKGIEDLIEAFKLWQCEDAVLLIAGRPFPPEKYIQQLQLISKSDKSIHLNATELNDDQLQCYLNAADVVALPFREVLTSSSVVLAMSFSRPVIVPSMGCLPELVDENIGFLYEPHNILDLQAALERAYMSDTKSMGAMARKHIDVHDWSMMAQKTAALYHQCAGQ